MILRKLERSDRQTCFGTFIRRRHKTSNGSNHTCHGCLYQKTPFQASKRHPALLPDTVPVAATALGSATVFVLRLHGGAGLQQQRDHLVAALHSCHVQWRLASGRRPRGSPHGSKGVSERELMENSQAAQAAHP